MHRPGIRSVLLLQGQGDGPIAISASKHESFNSELVEQERRLSGNKDLRSPGGILNQFAENTYGLWMQAQFRFVDDDRGWRFGLKKRRGKADEANRAIG